MTTETFEIRAEVLKVSEELGLVFGWAIVCSEDGEPYFDLQGDHIPQASMLKACTDFAETACLAREMHARPGAGVVVNLMPLTDEVAEAFGITCSKRGLMIAMKPDAEMLEKFKSGELTGFSIGGKRIRDEEVVEA